MIKTTNIILINGDVATIIDTSLFKALKSEKYNFLFNKQTGFFIRWGKGDYTNLEKGFNLFDIKLHRIWSNMWGVKINIHEFFTDLKTDGDFSVTAPEIVDWEISEKCSMGCAFCYKSNTIKNGKNISFKDFKDTFHKLPPSVTSIAFGIGSIDLCPDLWDILDYTKSNDIIPTITINGEATDDDINKLVKYCGAVAVSVYDKDKSYDTVKKLTDKGLKQCNLHVMISEETYDNAFEILNDIKSDIRLSELRSIVFLSLKEKGRSVGRFTNLSQEKFDNLFKFAIDNKISIGFDSCSAAKANIFINKNTEYEYMKTFIEPCEAGGKYSAYINVNSEYFPCSFTEGTDGWKQGIMISNCNDFMTDVWFNKKTTDFGDKVSACRKCNIGCPIYDV